MPTDPNLLATLLQKASSIGADPQTDPNNQANWKLGMMPLSPSEMGLGGFIDRIKGMLKGRSIEAAGELVKPRLPPEFTPVGGEAAYNAMQPRPSPPSNLAEQIYQRILNNGGR
jgi:hypothetical protein